MYKYVCPKCKAPYMSKVQLIYCVCGGKLSLSIYDLMKAAADLFGKDNPFSVELGKAKK